MTVEQSQSKALPIAGCSLDQYALEAQLQRWRRLAEEHLLACHRRQERLTLTYRARDALKRELATLVSFEEACCPFLTWTVTHDGAVVILNIQGNSTLLDEIDTLTSDPERRPASVRC